MSPFHHRARLMVRPPVGFYPVSPEMGAASGIQHDDMNSWSHCELARRQAAALGNDTMPEEFVVGVDVGQSSNPTAICVMSRIDGPNPRTDRHFEPVEPPMQPESTTPAGDYVGSPEWFADLDEQQKRAVAGAVFPAPLALKATTTAAPLRTGAATRRCRVVRDRARENAVPHNAQRPRSDRHRGGRASGNDPRRPPCRVM